MVNWDFILRLTKEICSIGRRYRDIPSLHDVEPFKCYFTKDGRLKRDELDEYDGKFTRREIIARYLLVSVVLDQGPDIVGVRELLKNVTTALYRNEIRIFHRPIDFFRELNISIDEILEKHESIKKIRAAIWAKEIKSTPSKYNLFFTTSLRGIVPIKQVLDYAIHRWGVPLCLPLLLEKDLESKGKRSSQPLVDYLETYPSAELMAINLKDNERYGLGSAIGDKACHLFAKLYVSIFKLVKNKPNDPGWSDFSYEIPFDSNVGRVLFRTGFLLEWASKKQYEKWNVIQKGKGKGKTNYIRVTNIRGNKTTCIPKTSKEFVYYRTLVSKYLCVCKNPQKVEIQRLPNLILYKLWKEEGCKYSMADFDDGLIYIGTKYCFNTDEPDCKNCPLAQICQGYNNDTSLITDYRT